MRQDGIGRYRVVGEVGGQAGATLAVSLQESHGLNLARNACDILYRLRTALIWQL